MIELRNVTKKFGNLTAVDNISMTVPPGEFFGFLGPNGAGKTTTIKMMAGLFAPTSGQILINGFDVVQNPIEAKLWTSYVPDQPFLYDKLTGREFLYFIGGLYKMKKREVARKIEEVIEHFEIGEWVDKRTEDYSQGMRQRVTIAAAFVHEPKVLIIDEPMVGLDPRSAKIVRETLHKMSANGVSIFMSTHSLPMAEELCDRVGFIKDGRLVFLGTKEDLQVYKQKYDGKFESVFLELTK
jgi:ABC-2 type transport system ATP-binding protein